jgi:hypothetical protein
LQPLSVRPVVSRPAAAQPGGDSYTNIIQPGANLIANQLDRSPDNQLSSVLPTSGRLAVD